MRALTDLELNQVKLLAEKSVELSFIEPTETGLGKSIMDATGSVRAYLRASNIHDFEEQEQGQEHKVQVESYLISHTQKIPSTASLYRPNTKKGDPRIWFSGLGRFANANDILGIIAFERRLYVLNITQLNSYDSIDAMPSGPLKELVMEMGHKANTIADELLMKLMEIASRGFVPALLQADTSIGRTLEHLLGIPMNSSRTPDYKGIELKSARENKGTRKGLFAKTPDWELSKFKTRAQILDAFGREEKGVFRLYNTIRATGRNQQGQILRTDYDLDYLIENSDKPDIGDFLVWQLETLKQSLLSKHKETFWIDAESKTTDNKEFFHYKKAIHTKNPLVGQFGLLIDIGAITLDYPMKRMPNGTIIDKGCNFKIKSKSLELLFPASQTYSLIR